MTHPVPDFLSKRGITKVETNLQTGQRVTPQMPLLFLLFNDQIMQACTSTTTKTTDES